MVTAATITTSRSGGIPADVPAGSVAFWALSGIVALVLLLVAGQSVAGSRGRRKTLGWFGLGPVVLACVAVAFAQGLTFFVVRAAGWAFGVEHLPDLFTHLGAGFAVLTAGIVILMLVRAAATWATRWGPEPSPTARESLERAGATWPDPADTATAARLVRSSRRLASFLRRAETFVLWLAVLAFISLCVGVLHGFRWLTDDPQALPWFVSLGPGWGIAGLWAAVGLVVLVVVLSSRNESRPLSLLWDLMCFLPTQAHPFGPPCYSERVVPEMADRIEDWLRGFDQTVGAGSRDSADDHPGEAAGTQQADRRRVILAAHSMGLVLAISVLFHLHARGVPAVTLQRIGVVSYGVQVRRYFARFFPGVFGPHVLSLVPAESPAILGRDPWPPHLEHERDGTPAGHPVVDLRAVLGERWINLYRPNDPLGFPVRYGSTAPAKDMDRHAEEFDPSAYRFTVAAHLHYLPTRAYRQAVRDLAGRLHPPTG